MKNKITIIIIIFIVIVTSAFIYAYYSPTFLIKTIKLRGVKNFDENLIISFTENYIGENLIYLKKDKIDRKLNDVKYIKEASFKRILPDTALFSIKESELIFRLIKDSKYYYIDKEGNIYNQDELQRKIILPVLIGFDTQDKDKIKFSSQMDIFIINLEKYFFEDDIRPGKINLSNNQITLEYDNRYNIRFGELENIEEKFNVLDNIIDEVDQKDYDVSYIDISIYTKPVLKLNQ